MFCARPQTFSARAPRSVRIRAAAAALVFSCTAASGRAEVLPLLAPALPLALGGLADSGGASGASGQPSGYDEAVSRGFRAFEAGDYAAARAGFLEAHAIYPNARTLRALGKSEYELSHYVEAFAYLEDALRSDERPLTPEQRAEAEVLCDELRGMVARFTVLLRPETAELTLDGEPARLRADGGLLVEEGRHRLAVRAPGYASETRAFSARAGEDGRLEIALVSAAASAPSEGGLGWAWAKKPWLWAAVGAAVAAGVVVGVVAAADGGSEASPSTGTTRTIIRIPAARSAP
jgi:tetratricopeptide (TPR) repeat protein